MLHATTGIQPPPKKFWKPNLLLEVFFISLPQVIVIYTPILISDIVPLYIHNWLTTYVW